MNITDDKLADIIKKTVLETLKALGLDNSTATTTTVGNTGISNANSKLSYDNRSAYQKTEQLLYLYNKFKAIVEDANKTILEYRTFGVPQRCGSVTERVQTSIVHGGIVLPEEAVEIAVANVQRSVEDTVQAIAMIDKALEGIKFDPWYDIIPLFYFDGRTQDDIAYELDTTQKTISKQKSRLVRELSLNLFPDQVVRELLN